MATLIRPEISEKNKYWIDKHRYYELKHFCLQYPIWKSLYADFVNASAPMRILEGVRASANIPSDPTANKALLCAYYAEKMQLIDRTAMEADRDLYQYILKAVTEELSYTYLKSQMNIPCGRDMYYDRYRRFFWLLSEARG